jgi:hypothetical protein
MLEEVRLRLGIEQVKELLHNNGKVVICETTYMVKRLLAVEARLAQMV